LRFSRQLRRGGPVAVGTRRDSAAGVNQFLGVSAPRFEVGAEIHRLPSPLGGCLGVRRPAALFLGLEALLLCFVPLLEMTAPRRSGDRAGQHRTDDAALADDREQVVRGIAPIEYLGVLNAVDSRGDRDSQPFYAGRMRLGCAIAAVCGVDDDTLRLG